MIELSIPETFQSRPYAREHYSRIARWALAHHPFYRQLVTDPGQPFPILTRSIAPRPRLLAAPTIQGRVFPAGSRLVHRAQEVAAPARLVVEGA